MLLTIAYEKLRVFFWHSERVFLLLIFGGGWRRLACQPVATRGATPLRLYALALAFDLALDLPIKGERLASGLIMPLPLTCVRAAPRDPSCCLSALACCRGCSRAAACLLSCLLWPVVGVAPALLPSSYWHAIGYKSGQNRHKTGTKQGQNRHKIGCKAGVKQVQSGRAACAEATKNATF